MGNKKTEPKKKELKQFRNVALFLEDQQRVLQEKLSTNVGIAYIIKEALDLYFERKRG